MKANECNWICFFKSFQVIVLATQSVLFPFLPKTLIATLRLWETHATKKISQGKISSSLETKYYQFYTDSQCHLAYDPANFSWPENVWCFWCANSSINISALYSVKHSTLQIHIERVTMRLGIPNTALWKVFIAGLQVALLRRKIFWVSSLPK